MNKSTAADLETVQRLAGLFVGQLSNEEMESFSRCLQDGKAYRQYVGASGFMGLAKVALRYQG